MFDIDRVKYDIENRFYSIHFSLYHNINLIIDASGRNKSNFVSAFSDCLQKMNVRKVHGKLSNGQDGEYEVKIFDKEYFDTNFNFYQGNYLIVIDDVRFFGDFISDVLRVNQNIIFIIVSRPETNMLEKNKFSCFYDAVFSVDYKKLSKKNCFTLLQMSSLIEKSDPNIDRADVCVIEGQREKSEYYFVYNFYHNIICARGKCNVVKVIKDFKERYPNKSIVVFIDLCAFGTELYKYITEFSEYNDIYLVESLSFEYDMYCAVSENSYMYKNINTDYPSGQRFEVYFALLLSMIDFDKCGRISKSRLVKCLYNECKDVCKIPENNRSVCKYSSSSLSDRLFNILCRSVSLTELYKYSGGTDLC